MTYPQVTLPTLEALYQLGTHLCAEIEQFQPEVVIGLAHSGWMPVVVTQALWAETRSTPFPPTVRTNFGQEKHEIYHARFGKSRPSFCCGECSNDPGRLGHYLAWLSEQKAWLKTLRRQIRSIFRAEPTHILVVDDVVGGYRTGYGALALVEALYPKAKAYVCAGRHDWTNRFVTGWLTEFAPSLAIEITGQDKGSSRARYDSPWQATLKPLITGTEDIAPDRLDWKFISRESPAVQAVADRIPIDVALSAPEWAKNLACAYAVQRLRNEITADASEPQKGAIPISPLARLSIEPEARVASRAWLQGGATRADLAQVYGNSLKQLKQGLRAVREPADWQIQGQRKNAYYFPTDSFEPWLNAYDPPDRPKPEVLMPGFAEFLPGEIWAGVYPTTYIGQESELFKNLLNTGVNRFIDLTNSQDPHRELPYGQTLQQASQAIDRAVEVKSFPLPFRASPDRRQVRRILSDIGRALQARQRLYIHAGYHLEGRTPLILACLLIERGYSAKRAVAKVNTFWSKTLPFLICSPLSEEQQQFILDW